MTGFFGKLPSRGDFVGTGLAAATVSAWDDWMQRRLADSQTAFGSEWTGLWLVAPVWHFALPPGQCGPYAITGLFIPSVDRVGRYFPLLAAFEETGAGRGGAERGRAAPDAAPFHDAVEEACRTALAQDWSPDMLLAGLAEIAPPADAPGPSGRWWTEGGPHVAAGGFETQGLPDEARFLQMLRA